MRRILLLPLILLSSFAHAEKQPAVVFVPKERSGPVRVVVWLHGYRNFPGTLSEHDFQSYADRLGFAIVGFPATTDLGDDTQQWSEEPVADHAYIQSRLAVLAQTHSLDLRRVGFFGFSQGAMVAADLCVRFPDQYAGALVMSPGYVAAPAFDAVPSRSHRSQVYVLVVGAGEHPGNVDLTREYANLLKKTGAKVTKLEYDGMTKHTRPPDFSEKFPVWMKEIMDGKETGEPSAADNPDDAQRLRESQ